MQFDRIVRAIVCAGTVLGATLALPTASPATDEQSLVEAGRWAGRVVVLLRDPWPCALLLLRARCTSDVTRYFAGRNDADFKSVPKIGPRPLTGLQAFIDHGDRDGYDSALSYLNVTSAPASLWKSDARAATLYDIGALEVAIDAARGNTLEELLAIGPATDLRENGARARDERLQSAIDAFESAAAKTADGTSGLPAASLALADASLKAFPEPNFPRTVSYVASPAGSAIFGVSGSWVAELVDNPAWIMQSDATAFVNAWLVQSAAIVPQSASIAHDCMVTMRARPFDHDRALRCATAVEIGVVRAGSADRAHQILAGSVAAQLAYNAAVLRDSSTAAGLLRALGNLGDLDGAIPEFAKLRATAAGMRANDWAGQFALGDTLVAAIFAASPPN